MEKTRAGTKFAEYPSGLGWASLGETMSRKWCGLDANDLCAEAKRQTRLTDFGDTKIEARLSALTRSLETEANLHPLGRFLTRKHLQSLLETHLRLIDLWHRAEPLDQKTIERPIFITGMPRSGSTLLHELFVQDPEHRAPLVWEVMCPPLRRQLKRLQQRRSVLMATACLWLFRKLSPLADSVHPMRATSPQECIAIHSYSLLSQEFLTLFRVPGYEAFLNAADFTPAYEWQKRFLEHLHQLSPAKRWVLKAPDHIYNMESLFRVFPDARIIQTHRDPVEVLKSSLRLMQVLRGTFSYPENLEELAAREVRVLADGLERITRFRDTHPELAGHFVDVNYRDLIANPVRTLRWCYWQLGLPWSDDLERTVYRLASSRSRYPHYNGGSGLRERPIDIQAEAWRFKNYCARFVIPRPQN